MSNVIDLFKIPVYKTKLNLDTKKILNYFLKLKLPGRKFSNVGGYQSQDLNGSHPSINNLFLEIEKHSNIFSQNLDIVGNVRLSNLWININRYKDLNLEHNHAGCILSGVYYLKTPKDCGNIVFTHPCTDFMAYAWPYRKEVRNSYSSSQWFLKSEVDELILFPGWLKHYVEPNLSKQDRVSISFNLV